jgi:hypothetical protein
MKLSNLKEKGIIQSAMAKGTPWHKIPRMEMALQMK